MFVLELTYTAPLDAVDALLEAHVAWLDEQFAKGVFLAAGRKEPRDGGIILALFEDRAQAEELTAGDPFSTGGVCTYRIIEFVAARTAPALEQYRATSG
ncbi:MULTISPECIES: YciI family protein [unclassified Streptomyces]|uniref:YciI family protein n=1 Tax=unclassified Streptomyces TaxID=2593676 RepID=UPI00225B6EC1|nr:MULTISPECIES: YciI family protein [unclassified Streptomyces]MCX4885235.1 YciI family protein [Streptomyces sp. NBC_00847]MCX5425101.1 YciI family protein [Streptomyces sp. NBC_00078]